MTRRALICAAALTVALDAGAAPASAQSAQPRVVGGVDVSIAQFPWQAAVVRTGGGSAFNRQFCGGSLVTSRIVITAAHCVYDTDPDCGNAADCTLNDPDDGTPRIDPDEVSVVLGRTTLSSGTGVEHVVDQVAYQGDTPGELPAYNPNHNPPGGVPSNDVGYLVLSSASGQTPIKIAAGTASERSLWDPGVFVDITGWGATAQGGPRSDNLKGASVPIVSDPSCQASYDGDFNPATMVCAGYSQGGIDTCQGDSGGPLQSPLLGGGYRLVGITSWGFGCAQPGFPGVYTRVAEPALRDAIEAKVDVLEAAQLPPLTDDTVIGDGTGQPRGGITFPPPSAPPASGGGTVLLQPTSTPWDPFEKCRKIGKKKARTKAKRIKRKRKRKRCMAKVRASL